MACLPTTVGTLPKPKRVISCVLRLTASFLSSGPPPPMPPPLLFSDASCWSIAATGSAADNNAAPCAVLVALSTPTGIQTKRACDFSGLEAAHSAAQWGHWASKNT